ncbi:hypothetical protein BG004_006418 [Podila humilis]|nr:hypothetical protein BG004_006418 [Podila humilis]
MSNWRQFFKDGGFTSKQRGSASSEWLKTIQSDGKKMEDWQNDKKERQRYWKDLEGLEEYVSEITGFVSKDKVEVGAKHSSDIATYLKPGPAVASSSNAAHPTGRTPRKTPKPLPSVSSAHSLSSLPRLKSKIVRTASQKTSKPSSFVSSAHSSSSSRGSKSKPKSQALVAPLQEPWKALMEVALALNHGLDADIPEGGDISHLSATRQQLYLLALDNLRVYKSHSHHTLARKDASVALSCTVNLSCEGIQDYFETEFLTRAANAYQLPMTVNRTRAVLDRLQKLIPGHGARFVLEEVRILKGRYQEQQRAGEVVPDHWESMLDVLEHVGECVSDATKDFKAILDEEYEEFGTFGRKVDLIFHANGQELANLEFKVAEAAEMDIEIQNRKNIRLNRAIMESQSANCDVKSTILFLDFQGWHGSLFALYPFEDIFVSKYLASVELPRSTSGLKRFLQSDTLELLYTFADHLVAVSDKLRVGQEEKQDLLLRKRHRRIFDLLSSPPTPPQKERRLSNNVFLTPTKRK